VSLLAVVALGMGYEYMRALCRRYSATADAGKLSFRPRVRASVVDGVAVGAGADNGEEASSLLSGRPVVRRRGKKLVKALFYGVQVFYSFFIM
jgi:copper transporter 1